MQMSQEIDESRIIAIDSKSIKRTWEGIDGTKKLFHGLLGVSLSVFHLKNFKESYEKLLNGLFDKYHIPKEEHVYKSAQIFSIFSSRPYVADYFLKDFSVDFFEGEESRAWHELVTYNTVNTVAKGDNCNCYISAADMILRTIDRQLEKSHKFLVENDLWDIVLSLTSEHPTNINIIRVWNPDLHYIKPIKPIQIQPKFFVKHPIIFVFNENDTKGEKKEIENSPLMRQLFDRAYESNGGIIFYESGFSTNLMKDGDWFVSYGTKGFETYKRLKKMGYNLNHHNVME
jgi:hypothetical protein